MESSDYFLLLFLYSYFISIFVINGGGGDLSLMYPIVMLFRWLERGEVERRKSPIAFASEVVLIIF